MQKDLIVIGGGTAGLGAARSALVRGARPVLITDGPIGGDCTFTGCVPSKTLIADSARGVSFEAAIARVHENIDRIAATESAEVLRAEGIEVVEGRATMRDPGLVEVDGSILESEHVIIATGARPSVPPIDGLSQTSYLTSETLWELDSLPASMAIIGAGAIGAEMAMAFARFGCSVTLIEAANRVLPVEEPEASAVIDRAMGGLGIDLFLGALVESVGLAAGSADNARIEVNTTRASFAVDALLVATGRRPNTDGLDLEAIGVDLDVDGHVIVNDKLETSVDGVSAAGDVTGMLPFTHAADEQGRMAAGHALGKGLRWSYDASTTLWVTFTTPEVARLGVTETEAVERGGRVAHLPLSHVDRAITEGRTDGFVKLIAGPRTVTRHLFGGRLIGATIVADRAGEMIHGPAMAARIGMFVGRLAQVTTPYPTWSTAVQQAAAQFFQEIDGFEARPARRQEAGA